MRKLAYRVEKRNEGYYVLMQFTAVPQTVKEVERRLRVNDAVLKYHDGAHRREAQEARKAEEAAREARRPQARPRLLLHRLRRRLCLRLRPAGPTPGAPMPGAPSPSSLANAPEHAGVTQNTGEDQE